jgi:hypothetical protein
LFHLLEDATPLLIGGITYIIRDVLVRKLRDQPAWIFLSDINFDFKIMIMEKLEIGIQRRILEQCVILYKSSKAHLNFMLQYITQNTVNNQILYKYLINHERGENLEIEIIDLLLSQSNMKIDGEDVRLLQQTENFEVLNHLLLGKRKNEVLDLLSNRNNIIYRDLAILKKTLELLEKHANDFKWGKLVEGILVDYDFSRDSLDCLNFLSIHSKKVQELLENETSETLVNIITRIHIVWVFRHVFRSTVEDPKEILSEPFLKKLFGHPSAFRLLLEEWKKIRNDKVSTSTQAQDRLTTAYREYFKQGQFENMLNNESML